MVAVHVRPLGRSQAPWLMAHGIAKHGKCAESGKKHARAVVGDIAARAGGPLFNGPIRSNRVGARRHIGLGTYNIGRKIQDAVATR